MARKLLTEEQINHIKMLYLDGATYPKIAQRLREDGVIICNETVRTWLVRSGITMRPSRDSLIAPVNEHYFDIIDSEQKAYWLGFLVADACIGKSAGTRRALRFYLANKDAGAVEQFASDISYEGKLRHMKKKCQIGITFNSVIFCNSLINLGYLLWKNEGSPKILENLRPDLVRHFIRGFFDGDGCISCSKKNLKHYFNIVADKLHYRALDAVGTIISQQVELPPKPPKERKTCIAVGWNGNQQVARFGLWLYKDATRLLERKKCRFDGLGPRIDFDFNDLKIDSVPVADYKQFYDNFHYMGAAGRRGFTLGAYLNGQLVAACTIGSITRVETATRLGYQSSEVRELARFCISPRHHVNNFPTWFMSRCVKAYKTECPNVKLLVSFADTTQGHSGTIYKAANWKFDGETGCSYHYVDSKGNKIHKKTVFDTAKKMGLKENEYVKRNNLRKIKHLPKKRFTLQIR
jgi:hypothetical protein